MKRQNGIYLYRGTRAEHWFKHRATDHLLKCFRFIQLIRI